MSGSLGVPGAALAGQFHGPVKHALSFRQTTLLQERTAHVGGQDGGIPRVAELEKQQIGPAINSFSMFQIAFAFVDNGHLVEAYSHAPLVHCSLVDAESLLKQLKGLLKTSP